MGIVERTLTIKRMSTVLSNHQEEQGGDASSNSLICCGRNCLGKCCLPVWKLPLYAYKIDGEGSDDEATYDITPHPMSFLVQLLLGQWEDRATRGLFKYDVTQCETKVVPGRTGFIAQLNEGRRLKKRATEFRIDQVLQPFDENKFNFTKVSPIDYGHVLLIPNVLDKLPQRIDHASFLLALSMAKEAADPFFRVGYNSLGAFATINHLHFQAYYIQVPFAVEKAPVKKLSKCTAKFNNGVIISQLLNYPVRGLVFEGGKTVQDISDAVASSCIFLQNNNIPFNVMISGFGKKIYLFLQCYAEKQALGQASQEILETQVNPAVWEISGHIVLKRRQDYEKATEEYTWRLLAEVSLSEDRFQAVVAQAMKAVGVQQADMNGVMHTNEKWKNLDLLDSTPTIASI